MRCLILIFMIFGYILTATDAEGVFEYDRVDFFKEEDVKKKAASEVHAGTKNEDIKKDKKSHKSIEDAINKAMKDEKEVIYMDD